MSFVGSFVTIFLFCFVLFCFYFVFVSFVFVFFLQIIDEQIKSPCANVVYFVLFLACYLIDILSS